MARSSIEEIAMTERGKLVKRLFTEALECAPAERRRFLATACAGDVDLQTEVESLLSAPDLKSQFLNQPASPLSASQLTEQLIDEGWSEGKKIGAYRIERAIGRGGMGTVYRAERVDGEFRKTVAIKLIHGGLGSEEIIRRFQNERQ